MSDIITDLEQREGGAAVTNDPLDGGGRTQYGISEAANPEAWKDGKVTEEEARAIYQRKYIDGPKFNLLPSSIQPLLIDWGVISGPQLVIMKLQGILNLPTDGIIGAQTVTAAQRLSPQVLNNLLVAERVRQVGRIIVKDPTQVKYLNGWLNRALSFLL